MSGVAEKARFYLEQAVPQLREWEDKEIFPKDEIRTIVQKRSDFEHRILAPGSTPSDFSDYVSWEKSLEALKTKRCRRRHIHHLSTNYAGQARIFKLYERAVTRFPADASLWREYLDYAAKMQASKRWRTAMTRALRLLPADAGLWTMAARRAAVSGDMITARSTFMRACRFCVQDETVWLEYARCEMEWLAKVEAKKQKATKGADVLAPDRMEDEDQIRFSGDDSDGDVDEDGKVIMPDPSTLQPPKVFTDGASAQLESNPALEGAIPKAIFDICCKQPFFSPDVAIVFFDMFAQFSHVPVGPHIVEHVVAVLRESYPTHPATSECYIRLPVAGVSPHTASFPRGLRQVLPRIQECGEIVADKQDLNKRILAWTQSILGVEELDPAIKTVMDHIAGMVQEE